MCQRLRTELNFFSQDASPSCKREHNWTDNTNDKSKSTKQLSSPVTHCDFLPQNNSPEYIIQCLIDKGFCMPIHGRNNEI
jgi:hypothetical protein